MKITTPIMKGVMYMMLVLVYLLIGVVVAIICDKRLVKQFEEFDELELTISRFLIIITGPLFVIITFIRWMLRHIVH